MPDVGVAAEAVENAIGDGPLPHQRQRALRLLEEGEVVIVGRLDDRDARGGRRRAEVPVVGEVEHLLRLAGRPDRETLADGVGTCGGHWNAEGDVGKDGNNEAIEREEVKGRMVTIKNARTKNTEEKRRTESKAINISSRERSAKEKAGQKTNRAGGAPE